MLTGFTLSVPALFLAGLASSPHCALMCGPLIVASNPRSETFTALLMQLGRLFSYTLLGALAGSLGGQITRHLRGDSALFEVGRLAAAAALLLSALWVWRRPRLPAGCIRCASSGAVGTSLQRWLPGVLWGLIPCGLLYAALTLAAFNGSAVGGAALTAAFGLGTTPALLGVSALRRRLPGGHGPQWSAALLAIAGLWIAASGYWFTPLLGWCRSP